MAMGTAFLIQFATCYLLAAVPMLYMEIAMGQFTSASPWLAFEMISPAMAGIPAALGFNIILRIVTSSVWITHALALFGISLTGVIMKLPWADCMDMFGCYDVRLADRCTFASPNDTFCADFIKSLVIGRSSYTKDTPLVSYLHSLLKEDQPMSSENFIPHPLLVVVLLMVWLIANVAQNGGVYLLGNTSFIVIPIAVISLIMTVTTAIVVGDIAGSLYHFYQHRFNKLLEVKDWIVAAGHAVFILNVSTGGMIKLASSRPFHLPILRDVITIAVVTLLFHAVTLLSTTAIIDGYAARVYPYDTHDERFGYVTERRYLVMAIVGEALVGATGGWILNALYFLGIAVVPLQKLATDLWVVVSMLREKYNEAFQEHLNRRQLNIASSLIVIFGFIVNLPFIMSGW
ncbi:unnamed protein product [Angiostrongylus costaricensis]|uniref:Aa_trans domain-containing protein n=1 Tax=Angiostrongylus costaricensis TaxID=334426 RepID=A0A158PKB9_ANGCS|nr:unnamed protein product [Angiostrongylus costaricensis]